MSDVPRLSVTIEVEGSPRLELRAEDADLASLYDWLASPKVRAQIDALVTLATGRTPDD